MGIYPETEETEDRRQKTERDKRKEGRAGRGGRAKRTCPRVLLSRVECWSRVVLVTIDMYL